MRKWTFLSCFHGHFCLVFFFFTKFYRFRHSKYYMTPIPSAAYKLPSYCIHWAKNVSKWAWMHSCISNNSFAYDPSRTLCTKCSSNCITLHSTWLHSSKDYLIKKITLLSAFGGSVIKSKLECIYQDYGQLIKKVERILIRQWIINEKHLHWNFIFDLSTFQNEIVNLLLTIDHSFIGFTPKNP